MPHHTVNLVTGDSGYKVSNTLSVKNYDQAIMVEFFSIVVYEGGSVMLQAKSLWRLELARTKWAGGYINWYHPMRIRHITTGLYLGVREECNDLCLIPK